MKLHSRIDYNALAIKYNALPEGGVIELPRPSSQGNVHRMLHKRRLRKLEDYQLRVEKNRCFIRKLSNTLMR